MWISIALYLQILGLIPHFVSATISEPIAGYLCANKIIWFQDVANAAQIAYNHFRQHIERGQFPAFFTEGHLFGLNNNFLLSWPVCLNWNRNLSGSAGKARVVINTDGFIVGVVRINFSITPPGFTIPQKCEPIYHFLEADQYLSDSKNDRLSLRYKWIGYTCNSDFKSKESFDHTLKIIQQFTPKTRRKKSISPYVGNLYTGRGLYKCPIRNLNSKGHVTSHTGKFWIVFRPGFTFMGVITNKDTEKKCMKTWSIKTTEANTYNTPSINPDDTMEQHNYIDLSCNGHWLSMSYVVNFISLAEENLHQIKDGNVRGYPIVQDSDLFLWPISVPERQVASKCHRSIYTDYSNVYIKLRDTCLQ
ncbi:BgtE-5964 [Blumeria graminis f. sp. tritici]|uniref:BgtE-5964 n=2 Tax=Blumeria graminis f. sp. tritici TaxID=62690 RepID=A0A061HGK7_BLUGR|nr:putative secreted effector protein [Blumeria graminis f. sp. tritici 96224]VCU40937.1 BgtE-5964 [Blumeria graminis f. sp. tritici]